MLDHPLNALMGYKNDKIARINDDDRFFNEDMIEEVFVEMNTELDETSYMVTVKMREPGETVEIELNSGENALVSGYMKGYQASADRTVDINRIVCDVLTSK